MALLALSCDGARSGENGTGEEQGADAAVSAFDAASSGAADAAPADANVGCGYASSFEPGQIAGTSPFGELDHDFDSIWFANGCGAMSAHLEFAPSSPHTEKVMGKFALPALQVSDADPPYSEAGEYDITAVLYTCDVAEGSCGSSIEAAATLEIRTLISDESLDPNTDFTVRITDAGWEIDEIVLTGHSCGWTWNPC